MGFVWALYSGLLKRAAELVVPVSMLSSRIEPPVPRVAPASPPPPVPAPVQVKKAVPKAPTLAAPLPVAINDPAPAPNAPTGATTPQPAPSPATVAAPVVAATVAAAPAPPPATPAVQLPSSDAEYLKNPPPPYPAISVRLNEQGKSMVRVLIGADGQPQRAEIAKSSGFTRLDEAALATVMRWRYVPGKRGGVAEAMWFIVPLNWELKQ